MILDITKAFYEICPDPNEFRRQVQEIASFRTSSFDINKWPKNLKFIVSHPSSRSTSSSSQRAEKTSGPSRTIHLQESCIEDHVPSPCPCNVWSRTPLDHGDRRLLVTEKTDAPGCTHFVAVSYCWPQPTDTVRVSSAKFALHSRVGVKQNDAPDDTIDRAMRFASACDLSAVWIDQECINQSDREDKEAGIQSMDVVYEIAERSVALLSIVIHNQETLDFFDLEKMRTRSFETTEDLHSLVRFVRWLDSERWFTRAWCMQESWSAGSNMYLMIKHRAELDKPTSLGGIDGEVVVNYSLFSILLEAIVSKLESCQGTFDELQVNGTWLKRFRRKIVKIHADYLHDTQFIAGSRRRMRCSAAEGLYALTDRQNSRIVDRLAILGNLCNYEFRLNTEKLEEKEHSFSLCAAFLAAMNGDISIISNLPCELMTPIRTHLNAAGDGAVGFDEQDPQRIGYSWAPLMRTRLDNLEWISESVNPVRLTQSNITSEGLSTLGWIFECDLLIDVSPVQQHYKQAWDALHAIPRRSHEQSTALTSLKTAIIWNIVRYLIHTHYFHLAQIIWEAENDFCLLPLGGTADPGSALVDAPSDLMTLFDFSTQQFIFPHCSESVFLDRLASRNRLSIASRDWLTARIMHTARLPCGRQISTGMVPSHASSGLFVSDDNGNVSTTIEPSVQLPWNSANTAPGQGPDLPFTEETVPGTPVLKSRYRAVYDSEEGFRKAVFTPVLSGDPDPRTMGRFWTPRHWVTKRLMKSSERDAWKIEGGSMVRGFTVPNTVWSECLLI